MGPEVPRLSRRALRAGRGALLHPSGFEVASGIQAYYIVTGVNSDSGNDIRMILPSLKSIFFQIKVDEIFIS